MVIRKRHGNSEKLKTRYRCYANQGKQRLQWIYINSNLEAHNVDGYVAQKNHGAYMLNRRVKKIKQYMLYLVLTGDFSETYIYLRKSKC